MPSSAKIKNMYPLTPLQEGMLFHNITDRESSMYHQQMRFRIKGELNVDIFEKSLNQLVQRHDIFRTVFLHEQTQKPVQVVLHERRLKVHYVDALGLSPSEHAEFIARMEREDRANKYDLSRDVLLRVYVIRLSEVDHAVIWSNHHIIMDGWCGGIVFGELFHFYKAQLHNEAAALPEVRPFHTYLKWYERQDKREASAYWSAMLDGFEKPTPLPFRDRRDLKQEQEQAYSLTVRDVPLSANLTDRLRELALHHQATLNTVLQAVWSIVLGRYHNTSDVVFGYVVSGRNPEVAGIEQMVGMFINTVPLRVRWEDTESFAGLLQLIQQTALDSKPYDYFPLGDIVARTPFTTGLLDHIMIFENYAVQTDEVVDWGAGCGLDITHPHVFEQTNYDFNLSVFPGSRLHIRFSYNASVYREDVIRRLEGHFMNVLNAAIADPRMKIRDIDIVTEEEKNLLLGEYNETASDYDAGQTISALFEKQANLQPDAVALIMKGEKLTYREVLSRSSKLAAQLVARGVGSNTAVALLLDRSVEMIVAILGVLQAGGAYVPMDPAHPEDRIRFMLEDSKAVCLITKQSLLSGIGPTAIPVFDVEDECFEDSPDVERALERVQAASRDLAYMIYTSGTTGKPKGVMIEHRAIHNLIRGVCRRIPFETGHTIVSLTTYSFDIFVLETLLPLVQGLTVVLADEEEQHDPAAIARLIRQHQARMLQITPSRLRLLLDDTAACNSLKLLDVVMVGGEALPGTLLNRLAASTNASLFNMYGPTETTVWSSVARLDRLDTVTIGKPLDNTRFYILNEGMRLQPLGAPGELCIAGDGLARGYCNRADLTEAKFVPNPFEPGQTMYRTGDMAKWDPSGEVLCLGRIDDQVKIGGYRIELQEISELLAEHEGVRQAVVIDRNMEGEGAVLAAYFVSNVGSTPTSSELLAFLKLRLPVYMLPHFFVQLEQIPVNVNGKTDRSMLPLPAAPSVRKDYAGLPPNDLEKKLLEIWGKLLKKTDISVNDNFFELGGRSLLASKLDVELERYHLKRGRLLVYKYSTVRELAAYIADSIQATMPTEDLFRRIDSKFLSCRKALAASYFHRYGVPVEWLFYNSFIPTREVYRQFFHNCLPKKWFFPIPTLESMEELDWMGLEVSFRSFARLADALEEPGSASNPHYAVMLPVDAYYLPHWFETEAPDPNSGHALILLHYDCLENKVKLMDDSQTDNTHYGCYEYDISQVSAAYDSLNDDMKQIMYIRHTEQREVNSEAFLNQYETWVSGLEDNMAFYKYMEAQLLRPEGPDEEVLNRLCDALDVISGSRLLFAAFLKVIQYDDKTVSRVEQAAELSEQMKYALLLYASSADLGDRAVCLELTDRFKTVDMHVVADLKADISLQRSGYCAKRGAMTTGGETR